MEQSLLADRLKLKVHWETREMPVYQLVRAKGGPKLKETTDPAHASTTMGPTVRAKAMPMHVLIDILEGASDVGGRVVIDKTGLAGLYDFSLKWAPMQTSAAPGGSDGIASTPAAEGPSLFTAIEEQLGLKLVATRGPVQVLVIDHIEQPSEN
jgi:uncharacterized protein (TIGR03435 family)